MSDLDQQVRDLAYRLWEQAGRPEGRSEEFWLAARQELGGGAAGPGENFDLLGEQSPEAMAQHGIPAGMPGERIAEQGVLDDQMDRLSLPSLQDTEED